MRSCYGERDFGKANEENQLKRLRKASYLASGQMIVLQATAMRSRGRIPQTHVNAGWDWQPAHNFSARRAETGNHTGRLLRSSLEFNTCEHTLAHICAHIHTVYIKSLGIWGGYPCSEIYCAGKEMDVLNFFTLSS